MNCSLIKRLRGADSMFMTDSCYLVQDHAMDPVRSTKEKTMSLKKYLLAAVLVGSCVTAGAAVAQQPLDLRYQMTFNNKRMGQQSFKIATLEIGRAHV